MTIDEQQASLMENMSYWKQQVVRHQANNQIAEASSCEEKIKQCESDLLCLMGQKPDMLSKADLASAHLNNEITRLIEQRTTFEIELRQLKDECREIIDQEAALYSATSMAPIPAMLPPAVPLPLPMTMLG